MMNPGSHTSDKTLFWLSILLSASVLLVFAFQVLSLAIDIPFRDDFQDILIFVVELRQADTVGDALAAWTHQHADHLTYSSRIIYYLAYLVEGQVNFVSLTVLSYLALLVIAFTYSSTVEKNPYKPLLLVCLLLLLFHPRAYGLVIWPMATFQWYFSYAWALLSLYLLTRAGNASFAAALALGFVATFTMSTGQLTWIVGALYLALRPSPEAVSRGRLLVVWLLAAIAALALFHRIYESVFPADALVSYALSNPLIILRSYVGMAGSAVGMGSMLWSEVLGSLACLLSLAFLIHAFRGPIQSAHLFLLYCLGSIGIIVLGRAFAAAAFDVPLEEVILKPRYTFASIMLWLTLFLLTATTLSTGSARKAVCLLLACTALNIGNYIVFTPALERHQQQRIDRYNKLGMTYSPEYPTGPTLRKAAKLDIYHRPEKPYTHK